MFFVIISFILISVVLVLSNDILFNKKRSKILKVIEFILCIIMIYEIFVGASNYIAKKNNAEYMIKNNSIFTTEMTVYNIDGTIAGKTSIGNFLYQNFVNTAFDGSTGISQIEFLKNNIVIIVITAILIVYWITLLLLFEKEQTTGYKIVEDEKMFEKYNPMIAACIAQNRNVMCRDIVGVILNLIAKEKIKIRIIPDRNTKDVGYRYMISENLESEQRLDFIEKDIYDWIFEELENFKKGTSLVDYFSRSEEGIIEIDLVKRLKEISENEDTYLKLKILNNDVKKRVNRIGGNKESVPFLLKAFNNVLILISLLLVSNHIIQNGVSITLTNLQILYYMFVLIFAIMILPIIYIFSLIALEFIRILLRTSQQITEGYTGRKLIAKSVSIIFATCIIIVIYTVFAKDFYIIYDILLLGVTCLIIFTDDYMLKHEPQILNDYYNLKRIENKISEYSLMKNENMEFIKIWDKYYAYGVALGVPMPVNKELDVPYQNTTILTPQNLEGIYYVSKAYLEVMWDMEFYDKKNNTKILSMIDKFV